MGGKSGERQAGEIRERQEARDMEIGIGDALRGESTKATEKGRSRSLCWKFDD